MTNANLIDAFEDLGISVKPKKGKRTKIVLPCEVLPKAPLILSNKGGLAFPERITKKLSLDCEFVGVKEAGYQDALARVSIVNYDGQTVYDKYVLPDEEVTDYRTFITGITKETLVEGDSFANVRNECLKIFKNKIICGHSLSSDFRVLKYRHPHIDIRDTSIFTGFKKHWPGRKSKPSLKLLMKRVFNEQVQVDVHDSVNDAIYALRLYKLHEKAFDNDLYSRGYVFR